MFPVCLVAFLCEFVCTVSGRSSAYGDTAVEGHPAGPGSVSSSTGAISTTTAQQEGDGSEGEGETEGDIHTSNRSAIGQQCRSSDKDESLRLYWQQAFASEDTISLQSMAMGRENIYFWGAVVIIKNITFSPKWSTQLQKWTFVSNLFLVRLHMVRLMLLERLLQHLSQLHNVGGVQAIPYMQVILMLTSDLDGEDEKDKGALDDLLAQLIAELGMHKKVNTVSLWGTGLLNCHRFT